MNGSVLCLCNNQLMAIDGVNRINETKKAIASLGQKNTTEIFDPLDRKSIQINYVCEMYPSELLRVLLKY